MAGIRIALFGPVRIWRGDEELPAGPAQQRALLGSLALAGGQPVGRADLVRALWPGEPPRTSWNVVQTHIKRMRALLEPDRHAHGPSRLLPSVGDGYALRIDPDCIDVQRFRSLVERAAVAHRQADHASVWSLCAEAMCLWSAPPAADTLLLSEHPLVTSMEDIRLTAVGRYLDAALALGRATDVVDLAEEAAAIHPFDELAQNRLIRVYQSAGRRADAFATYHRVRDQLVDVLGVEPGPELAATHHALLRSDLDPSGPPPGPTRHRPAQTPADITHFAGREAELATLDEIAFGGRSNTVAIVSGAAGVGKTGLAVRWAHRAAARFPDGCLYVDLRGFGPQPPTEPVEALIELSYALGIGGRDMPTDLAGLASRYRAAIAGRRLLVILDNARSPSQVRPLLPYAAGSRTIVTSRNDLAGLVARDGADRIVVEPLRSADAVSLLRALLGPRARDVQGTTQALVEACDRLPLALRIAAERVLSRPAETLAELVRDFTDHQRRLDLLNAGDDDGTAIRAVFSWSYHALPEPAARAFRLLGLHPGRTFDVASIAALTETDLRAAQLVADVLTRLNLTSQPGPGRYEMHDLLRSYARELAEQQESGAALYRLLDHLIRTTAAATDTLYPYERQRQPVTDPPIAPIDGAEQARAWLDAHTATLLAAAHLAAADGSPQHVDLLSALLHRHLDAAGRYLDLRVLHELALRIARKAGDRRAEGAALHRLGRTHQRLARYPEALEYLDLALATAIAQQDRPGESDARHGRGMVRYRLGEIPAALEDFERALAIACATGDRSVEGMVRGNIGLIHEWRGDPTAALAEYERALAIHRDTGHRAGEGDTLNNIAIVHRQANRYPQAIAHLVAALDVYRSISDRGGEGAALNNLGLAHIHLGCWTAARDYLHEALDVHRAIGGPAGEAETLNILGHLDHTMSRYDQAIVRFHEALALGDLTADAGVQTNSHHGLGEAHRALGNTRQALVHHRQALVLARRTGNSRDESRALEAIGCCATPSHG